MSVAAPLTLEDIIANAHAVQSPGSPRDSPPALPSQPSPSAITHGTFGSLSSPSGAECHSSPGSATDRATTGRNPRKRPAEDMSQYVLEVSRNNKLKPGSQEALQKFAKVNTLQLTRGISLTCHNHSSAPRKSN